jgi:hypothetical protein
VLTPFSVGPRQFGQFAETTVAHATSKTHVAVNNFRIQRSLLSRLMVPRSKRDFQTSARVGGEKEKPPGTLSGTRRLVACE